MMISNIDGKNITPEGAGKPARRVGEMIMPRQDTRVSPPPAQTEAPKTPEPEKDKGEKYVTVAEMQSKISQLLAGINSVIHSMSGRYALKTDVENALSGVLRNVNRDTVTRGEVESIAKQAVPKTIRDIDNSPRAGNVCLLSPGGASGTDSVYFGQLPPISSIPDGTELLPHLKWNIATEEWDIFLIVPDGSVDTPHLKWVDGKWTVVDLNIPEIPDGTSDGQYLTWNGSSWQVHDFSLSDYLPNGSAATPHLIWSGGAWTVGAILPTTATLYQVLAWNGGAWAADWTRWV